MNVAVALFVVLAGMTVLALLTLRAAGTDGGPRPSASRRTDEEWSTGLPSRPYREL